MTLHRLWAGVAGPIWPISGKHLHSLKSCQVAMASLDCEVPPGILTQMYCLEMIARLWRRWCSLPSSFCDSVGRSGTAKLVSQGRPKSSGKTGSERSQTFRMFGRFRWRLGHLKLCGPHQVWFLEFSTQFVGFFFRWMKRTDSSTTRTMS